MKALPSISNWRYGLIAMSLAVLLLASCVPLPVDPRWASVTTFGDQQNILIAFHDRIALIDAADGTPVELCSEDGQRLRQDDEGNPRTWNIQLSAQPATQFYFAPVVVDEQTLLMPSFTRRFYEIDAADARILTPNPSEIASDSTTSHIVADVLATDEFIYVPLSEGDITALDREDFGRRWKFDTEFGVWAQPLLADGVLYVPSLDHDLYALDAETGEQLWSADLGGAVASTPILHEGYLYVGSFGRRIAKIGLDGSLVAQFETRDWVWGTPTVSDNMLYIGDSAGWMYAFDLTEGDLTLAWQQQVATRAIRATPLVVDDMVIVASRDNNVYWLDRLTGTPLRPPTTLNGEILANMLLIEPRAASGQGPCAVRNVSQPLVIVSTMASSQRLFALPLAGGDPLWAWPQ